MYGRSSQPQQKNLFSAIALAAMALFIAPSVENARAEANIESPKPLTDISERYVYYHTDYEVNPDYSTVQTHKRAIKILHERALENLKNATISHSQSVETIEIIEAYTLKPDGHRVNVPKTNYQMQTHSGLNENSPVFSDRKTMTIVFPDVAVGDTLVLAYKRRMKEPMFPGYFAETDSFSTSAAYDDVLITLSVPQQLKGHYKINGLTEQKHYQDNKTIYQWSWKNPVPTTNNRKNFSVWNIESLPGFIYSSFDNYKAIAEAYGKRALPKVVASDEVKALAKQIVGSSLDKKENARLLYEWVAKNITFAGNCVGVGAVVPHDIGFVLENRMGDCKDHATLLQALYAAQGIQSEQALINSGNIYQLPSVPLVSAVNHVINYLPEFDLFVDATSDSTPFGTLPLSIQNKPVLLVEHYREGLRTPAQAPGSHRQKMQAHLYMQSDGSFKGDARFKIKGYPAIQARAGWRNVSKDGEEKWLKNLFSSNGRIGHASVEKEDPTPLKDTFDYSMQFYQEDFLLQESAGAIAIFPPEPTYFAIANLVSKVEEPEAVDVACLSTRSVEEYVYEFPDNYKILDVPRNFSVNEGNIQYSAEYEWDGKTLKAKRKFENNVEGMLCSPAVQKEKQATLRKIQRNLKNQIVYKPLLDE